MTAQMATRLMFRSFKHKKCKVSSISSINTMHDSTWWVLFRGQQTVSALNSDNYITSHISNWKEVKRIFSDSNNILLWRELHLQVMHDCVHWHCSIDYYVKLSLVDETLCKKMFSFHKEMTSADFLWGNVLLRGELEIDVINSQILKILRTPSIWNQWVCL